LAIPWDPNANDHVVTLALGDSQVFAGGNFGSIGGANRLHLAALDTTSGAAYPTWDPTPGGPHGYSVFALAASAGKLYVGGDFGSVDGLPREHVAAIDAATGTVTDWNPGVVGNVEVLFVCGSKIYAGGEFGFVVLDPDTPPLVTAVAGGPPAASDRMNLAPNPSGSPTRIMLDLERRERVRASVLDIQGREVALLAAGEREAGHSEVVMISTSTEPPSRPASTS
jgi:hypothetical protein